jgi:hypothetical protein
LKVAEIDGHKPGCVNPERFAMVVASKNTAQSNTHHGGRNCNEFVNHSMKENFFQGDQMKLEVIKQNEEAARHTSWGKRGLRLKEMVNIQSNLEDLQQQQHSRPLVMTHELNRFCRERLLSKRGEYERIAC